MYSSGNDLFRGHFNDLSGDVQLSNCSALKSIVSTYDGVMKISSKLGVNKNAILYVPDYLVEEYKANVTYTSLFKEKIKPISEFVEN